MNGFPVKKCSAFQFFKKRVRFSFNSFFFFFFHFLFVVVAIFITVLEQKVIEEVQGFLIPVSYCNKPVAWAILSNTKGNSTTGEGKLGGGTGMGKQKGITSAVFAGECISQLQLTTRLDAIHPAIQTGIIHSKTECRAVASCL